MVGVTSLDPYTAIQQSSATKLKTGTFVASGKVFTVNSNEVCTIRISKLCTVFCE